MRKNENIVYVATYITAEPSVGELRWITRLNGSVFTGVPAESNLRGNTGAIENSDVFGMSDGTTRSKSYGNQRAKDLAVRTGLHGPYALVFTPGATPAAPDMSWMSGLGLQGCVSGRGKVVLNGPSGVDGNYTYTVGFANSTARYWATASASGAATTANMKPGTYTMTVYKGELAVYTESVSVSSGGTTTLNTRSINNDPSQQSVVWRVGNWDGTPLEFLNGQAFNVRHPSDARNPSWGPVTYALGSATNKFPAAIWKDKNNGTAITFTLSAAQVAARTLRIGIGISAAYANGRPQVTVNNAWTSKRAQPLHAAGLALADDRHLPRQQHHVQLQHPGQRLCRRQQHADDQRGLGQRQHGLSERGRGGGLHRPVLRG